MTLQRSADAAAVASAAFGRHASTSLHSAQGLSLARMENGGVFLANKRFEKLAEKLSNEQDSRQSVRIVGPVSQDSEGDDIGARRGSAHEFANAPVGAAAQLAKQLQEQTQQGNGHGQQGQLSSARESAAGVGAAMGVVGENARSNGQNSPGLQRVGGGSDSSSRPGSGRTDNDVQTPDDHSSGSDLKSPQLDSLVAGKGSGDHAEDNSGSYKPRDEMTYSSSALGYTRPPAMSRVSCDKGDCLDLGVNLLTTVEGAPCRSLLLTGKCPKACVSALQDIVQHPSWPVCAASCRKDIVEGAAERWASLCLDHAESLLDQGKDVVKSIVGRDALHTVGSLTILRFLLFAFAFSIAVTIGYRRGATVAVRAYRSQKRRLGLERKMSDPALTSSVLGLQASSSV